MRSSKEGNGVLCSSCLLVSRGEKVRGGKLYSSSQHLGRGRRPPPPAAQRICVRGSAPTASALHPLTCPSADGLLTPPADLRRRPPASTPADRPVSQSPLAGDRTAALAAWKKAKPAATDPARAYSTSPQILQEEEGSE
jgi:hypothetical protein